MTQRLYYQDAYLKEFTARIEEIRYEECSVKLRLDRTAFYPEGGGQGADLGVLEFADGTRVKVSDVQEEAGEIWHTVSEELPAGTKGEMPDEKGEAGSIRNTVSAELPAGTKGEVPDVQEEAGSIRQMAFGKLSEGTEVLGRIDWERRFDHMQQHSGEHIVSGMICRRFHCDNVGFHLGEDAVTIDFNAPVSMEDALEIEAQANAYLWENHPFEECWPSAEALKTMEYRSKKELEGAVRITSFPGADTCACCGTHVSSSAQVGLLKFLSAKPFHEGTRLELLCGKRAAEYLSMNFRVNKEAAVLLSTSEENTAVHVKKLLDENLQLKGTVSRLEDRLLHYRAEQFAGKEDVLLVEEDLTALSGRALADLLAGHVRGTAAVFTPAEKGYQYAIIRRNGDISFFVKEMNQALVGRGGGRNGFAQGSVTASKEEIQKFFAENGFCVY